MTALREQVIDAKRRLPLPELLRFLNLDEHARKSARCPLHDDQSPSFSVWQNGQDWRWKCHAGCGEGDEIDFITAYRGITRADAVRRFIEMAGGSIARPSRPARAPQPSGPALPDDATQGTEADWRELASLRGLSWHAPGLAASVLGTLYFGTTWGYRSWIITDESRRCAEARRMDGKPFPAVGQFGERKAHSLRGSCKKWPVGLAPRGFTPADFRAILIVEGGPDYLAALHFTLADTSDCLPIAFLGAGSASTIDPNALALLRGQRVRFYPHTDKAGTDAVDRWADQLRAVSPRYDAFSFVKLRNADGSPVNDLNDCCFIHANDAHEIEGLLP